MTKRNKKREQPRPTIVKAVGGISSTLLDIIILARGRFDLLERCLASIPDAFPGIAYNVILVDNASSEIMDKQAVKDFHQRMESTYDNLTVIRSDRNLGFPAGCNLGARRKNSPILFFLNDDVILDPGSGIKLINALDDPDTGVVGMKLRFADLDEYSELGLQSGPNIRPAGRVQHAGLSVSVNGDVYHPFLGWETDHPKVNAQRVTFAVTGAALMLRRNAFTKAGGFYEGYGLGTFEDVDLCMMVREQGKQIILVPDATATHFTGATVEQLQTAYPMGANANLFRSRWMEKLTWWDFFIL